MLARIIAAAVLLGAGYLIPAQGWVRLVVFLVPYAVIGWDILWKAVRNISHGQVFDENFLMALATVGAFFTGEFPEAVAVMLFYQIGELFQSYAVGKSRQSIASLMDIRPDYANLERDGKTEQVDPEEVAVGDVILVKPGEKIPLDGVVLEGDSMVNTSALTGESVPREAYPGSDVISGCINQNGLLRIRVTKEFGESTVAKILDLVENSSSKKAKAENFITKFARWYTPAVVIAAVLLAVIPPLILQGGWNDWIHRALIFLVISCPCALVISVPLSFFGGIGGASRNGILVKGGNYLESLAHAETVVFDKTGTLTRGVFNVTAIHPNSFSEADLLELAALAESYSDHPISRSNPRGLRKGSRSLPRNGRGGAFGTRGARPDRRENGLCGQRQADGGNRRAVASVPPRWNHSAHCGGRRICRSHRHFRRGEAGCRAGCLGAQTAGNIENRHAYRRRESGRGERGEGAWPRRSAHGAAACR